MPLLFVENGIVQVEPNVQDCPLTVVAGFSNPAFGKPVALVRTRALGVPRFGVAKTALVPKTKVPVPFASLMMPRNCAEVVEANCDKGLPVCPQPAQANTPEPLKVRGREALRREATSEPAASDNAPVEVVTFRMPVESAPGRNTLVPKCISKTLLAPPLTVVVPFVVKPEMPPSAVELFH